MALATLAPLPAGAQTGLAPAASTPDVVVQGRRTQPSGWWEAETSHVVVLGNGNTTELKRITRNLERLHFVLSILSGRIGQEDNTTKLRVTLVGDAAEFNAMQLRDVRWQEGPFSDAWPQMRWYDPREDGPVMAATRLDGEAVIERGVDLQTALSGVTLGGTVSNSDPTASLGSPVGGGATAGTLFALTSALRGGNASMANRRTIPLPYENAVYAGFAQNFLLTYFPAAYPRWYLDGFGQLFATARFGDGAIEYGRWPEGLRDATEEFGAYPVKDVLSGRYLTDRHTPAQWTPFAAWTLTHYLFFAPERRAQLRAYLAALNGGASAAEAGKAFGDLGRLEADVRSYHDHKLPYEKMTLPAARDEEPTLRQLSLAQAAFVKGRIELGSRTDPARGTPKQIADANAAHDRWLTRLRGDAARFPGEVGAQLLLAEAECRSGQATNCAAAADRALALEPNNTAALSWKGSAMAALAVTGPAAGRETGLAAARAVLARANRTDTEAVLPLLAYYRSYTAAGEPAPAKAVDGLFKALEAVPAAPTTRLALGSALAANGAPVVAQQILRPVADGPYDTPERAAAQAALASVSASGAAGAGGAP
jgi:hypothetical protein